MKVYRLERPCGKGPYQSLFIFNLVGDCNRLYQECPKRHPEFSWPDHMLYDSLLDREAPEDEIDALFLLSARYYFGFESVEHLQIWFNVKKFRELLRDNGVSCIEYKVKDKFVLTNDKQLVFLRDCAVKQEQPVDFV